MKPSPGKRERGGWSGRKTRKGGVKRGGGRLSDRPDEYLLIFFDICCRMFENVRERYGYWSVGGNFTRIGGLPLGPFGLNRRRKKYLRTPENNVVLLKRSKLIRIHCSPDACAVLSA